MNQHSQPEIEGLRERIARVIGPEAWAFHDRHASTPAMRGEIGFEVSRSLAKADAVLALLSLKEGGGLSSSSSESAALLASQASCSVTPSSTGKED